ncbi:MAG: type IV toxin-antitoxin system AbiEi family antitoxin [Coriobacteriia bacterium]|nr:type IV toxin-antitoxin system AbiEi family antitoxin [Coriobacteriia bacterium]
MRGVYVSRAGRFNQDEPDPYLVAAAISSDAVMVYHSALELHGLAHSPSRRVQFATTRPTSDFVYRDFEFRLYRPPRNLAPDDAVQSTTLVSRPGGVVRVTTRERTLVDCVNHMDRSGGAEEVLRSLSALPYVDASNVLAYLRGLRSTTAIARVGWLLEQRAEDWYVSMDDLAEMRAMLARGPYYLTATNEAGTWVPSWRLYLPHNADDLMRWVNE